MNTVGLTKAMPTTMAAILALQLRERSSLSRGMFRTALNNVRAATGSPDWKENA